MSKARRKRPDLDGNLKEVTSKMPFEAIKQFNLDLWEALDKTKPPILLEKELRAISKGMFRDDVHCDLLLKCFLDPEKNKGKKEQIVILHWEFEGNLVQTFLYVFYNIIHAFLMC